jgi:SAM-dependent methyltransferase
VSATSPDPDEASRRLAAESLADHEPTGWFERLYVAADEGEATVPWDRGAPHPMLVEWAAARGLDGDGRRAIVVGSGFGEDAEYVTGLGFATVAFDISATAVRTARERFPASTVEYLTADLFATPAEWRGAFDLVVEVITVQALPDELRPRATEAVADLVAPGGTLIVISAARDEEDGPVEGPPWPLTRREVEAFGSTGLRSVRIEDLGHASDPAARRWRAEFTAPASGEPGGERRINP